MAALSNFLEAALLNGTLRNTAYTPAATVYIALYTASPTAADTGTEVVGGSYARQAGTFSAPSSGATQNSADITFTGMPACTVVAVAVRDALTTGNLLYWANLSVAKVVNGGDPFTIHAGDLVVTAS